MNRRWLATVCLLVTGCSSTEPRGDVDARRPIVYQRITPTGFWELMTVNAFDGNPTRLDINLPEAIFPALSPDGTQLGFVSTVTPVGVYAAWADGSSIRFVHPGSPDHLTWSPDGSRLAFSVDGEIIALGVDGSDFQVPTTSFAGYAGFPAWSPSGVIAFSTFRGGGASDIYAMTATGDNVRLLVSGDGTSARDPAWSPDGSQLAFALGDYGSSSIYVANANGRARRRVTVVDPEITTTDLGPVWSPSGEWIAFQREQNGRYDVFIVRPDGSDLRNLTTGTDWGGARPTW